MNKKIDVHKLSFSYDAFTPIFDNVTFSIAAGEVVTIVGSNGGGKTTLLKLLLGLLLPTRGSVSIDGVAVAVSQCTIGYVLQHSQLDNSFPLTVFDVVLSGTLRPFGFYRKQDRLLAEKMIASVGLTEYRSAHFSQLSGGQKQRMLIARALVSGTEILLLDEPTSNIDRDAERELNELLQELREKMTIVLVTHDMHFTSNITDRVLCVNRGVVEHPVYTESSAHHDCCGSKRKRIAHDQVFPSVLGGDK